MYFSIPRRKGKTTGARLSDMKTTEQIKVHITKTRIKTKQKLLFVTRTVGKNKANRYIALT